jgi:hypothetical protein
MGVGCEEYRRVVQLMRIQIALKPVAGSINYFYAFVNGAKLIADDGTAERTWKGDVPGGETRIKVRVTGMGDARYEFSLSLPDAHEHHTAVHSLEDGYDEFELRI